MSSPIRCHSLTKRFRRVVALDNLDLETPEGSIYALVGPNGAGKTTLIKTMVNILRPTSGEATLLNTDSRKLSPREFAQIGYVSENQELPEWMTVAYYLEYWKPFYPTWDDALARELVRDFDLPAERRLRQLSRGMKMKAALASSLAYRPRLIILDEPFTGLDPLVRDEFIQGLLARAADTTVLVSSHDLGEIESFASHIAFLDAGRLQFAEEIVTLAERFRDVQVTVAEKWVPRNHWPETWSKPQTASAVVRFVESRFDRDRTQSAIAELFPGALNVSVNPMSFREIFVTLARAGRNR